VTARLDDAGTVAVSASVQLHRQARQAAWAAARECFPPRPAASDWPATRMSHDSVLDMLSRAPFTLANPGSRRGQLRGVTLAVAWLADQPGSTWQQRWLASGAETAGSHWKQPCNGWLDERGVHVLQRLELLSIGLILAICADIIRAVAGLAGGFGRQLVGAGPQPGTQPRPRRVRPSASRLR
jgi:hypothetical protein